MTCTVTPPAARSGAAKRTSSATCYGIGSCARSVWSGDVLESGVLVLDVAVLVRHADVVVLK